MGTRSIIGAPVFHQHCSMVRRSSKGRKHRERGIRMESDLWSSLSFSTIDISRLLFDVYGAELERINAAEYLGFCPFHSETRPSYRVNMEKSVSKCYGCGITKTLYSILMDLHQIEAVSVTHLLILKEEYGLTQGEISKLQNAMFERRKQLTNQGVHKSSFSQLPDDFLPF